MGDGCGAHDIGGGNGVTRSSTTGSILTKVGQFNTSHLMGSYAWSIIIDWLLRGYDSMNQLFPTSTSPNCYLAFYQPNGTTELPIPRLALPRTTAAWTAPAASATAPYRYIQNVNALTTAAVTGSVNMSFPIIRIRMTSTPQSFDDTIYAATMNGIDPFICNPGDTVQFAAGQLQIAWG